MKCCHCSSNVFREIDEIPLCLTCYTDVQISSSQMHSASQAYQRSKIADSMSQARTNLLHKQNNERNTEVNNYNIHNNIHDSNIGILNTGKAQIKDNDINVANSAKPTNNISSLIHIMTTGFKWIASCLQILKIFP